MPSPAWRPVALVDGRRHAITSQDERGCLDRRYGDVDRGADRIDGDLAGACRTDLPLGCEVDEADRVMRLAFGTFLGAPDPAGVFGDAEMVRPRFAAEPSWAFGAEIDGELVGSSFATRWGSFGFVGPVTVRPDLWDRGIAGRLMQPVVDFLDRWQLRQAALFTFPHSPKHIGLYQKFGFWP